MNLGQEDWHTLSRLLDEALDLPKSERDAWVARLGAPLEDFKPALRTLLARQNLLETDDFPGLPSPLVAFPPPGLAATATEALAGTVIGPYRTIREIGHGGMGTVWLAERTDGLIKRRVALKLPHLADPDAILRSRFARERDILGALNHPHIARLYDAGVAGNGQPFLALEYVEGVPLKDYCDQLRLSVAQRVRLFLQVLEAVQYAHSHLVIHRDLKPSNILVTAAGSVRLLDFGIAKLVTEQGAPETQLTRLGGRALTPDYAAPEQIAGEPVSTAADIYSLGVILFELLAGIRPYRPKRDSQAALEEAILGEEPVKPSLAVTAANVAAAGAESVGRLRSALTGDLDTIVLKALKKSIPERYATAQALHDDLNRYLTGEPVLAQADSSWYRTRKFIRRRRIETAAAAVAVLTLTGFTLSLAVQLDKVARARVRADQLAKFMVHIFEVPNPDAAAVSGITARDLLDKAAGDIEADRALPPEERARLIVSMARSYTNLGAFDRSDALLRRELDRARAALGPDHAQTMALCVELLWELDTSWRYDAAISFGQQLLDRQRRALGADHPQTAITEAYLMHAVAAVGRFDAAVAMGSHALSVMKRAATADDLEIQGYQADIAFYRFRAGQGPPQVAEHLLRELVERYRSALGPANGETLGAINRLSVVLAREHRFDEEARLLQGAVADAQRVLGQQPYIVSSLLDNLSAALIHQGDLAGAEGVIRESLDINRRTRAGDRPRIALAEYNLACIMARRGQKAEALDLLKAALDDRLWPDAALHMQSDEDLTSLREEPRFKALVAQATPLRESTDAPR